MTTKWTTHFQKEREKQLHQDKQETNLKQNTEKHKP